MAVKTPQTEGYPFLAHRHAVSRPPAQIYLPCLGPQCKELTKVSLARLFIGGVHIAARALHVLNLIWFGSPIPVGGEVGNFLLQMISTCLATRIGRGEGVGTLCLGLLSTESGIVYS